MKNILLVFLILISNYKADSQNCIINLDSLSMPKKIEFSGKEYISKIFCVKYLSTGKMDGANREILKEVLVKQNLKLSTFNNTSIEFSLKDTNRTYYVPIKNSKQYKILTYLKNGTEIKIECIIFKDYFVRGVNFLYVNRIIF